MATFLSPGIFSQEINASTVLPTVSTTIGAFSGVFTWGPAKVATLVTSENELVTTFGKPATFNAETWFTAANFLAYGNQLYISRAANTANVFNAVANVGNVANIANHVVANRDLFTTAQTSFEANVAYIAKFPGDLGNSLKISVCDSANQYTQSIDLRNSATNTSFNSANSLVSIAVGTSFANVVLANSAALTGNTPLAYANTVAALFNVGDYVTIGNTSIGTQNLKIANVSAVTVQNTTGTNTGVAFFTLQFTDTYKLSTDFSSNTVVRNWEFFNKVNGAPTTTPFVAASGNSAAVDGMHVVVVDEDGKFSGTSGTILEVYQNVSRATDAKNSDGSTNYVASVINAGSPYVWYANDRSGASSANAAAVATSTATKPLSLSFTQGTNGNDETAVTLGTLAAGYDLFKNKEDIDISLVMQGKARGGINGEQLANYIIDNITESRKDCVAFISPDKADSVNNLGSPTADTLAFYSNVRDSTYAFFDSGYKYQYDKYNDIYRWIPLNGDTAGLCVYTDTVADPWFSPAGFNRGTIKNCVKLAFNPNQAQRDILYPNRINPVVSFKGQGTVLYGDRTGTAIASAFDRINVRRLFILLEKKITKASQALLFEFNDDYTRATFKNLVEPDLRDVQGRRGITAYKVICDSTNNTAQVIQENQFVGDIYIRPNYSINFLRLNFVCVGASVSFDTFVVSQ